MGAIISFFMSASLFIPSEQDIEKLSQKAQQLWGINTEFIGSNKPNEKQNDSDSDVVTDTDYSDDDQVNDIPNIPMFSNVPTHQKQGKVFRIKGERSSMIEDEWNDILFLQNKNDDNCINSSNNSSDNTSDTDDSYLINSNSNSNSNSSSDDSDSLEFNEECRQLFTINLVTRLKEQKNKLNKNDRNNKMIELLKISQKNQNNKYNKNKQLKTIDSKLSKIRKNSKKMIRQRQRRYNFQQRNNYR